MKSPIEIALRDAIRASIPGLTMLDDYSPFQERWSIRDGVIEQESEYGPSVEVLGEEDPCAVERHVAMYADVRVLSYRADIVVVADANGGSLPIVIECDGHEFHNLTKQQVSYDRARDRELTLAGIPTLRFTGSEIHHSVERCAAHVWSMVNMLLAREDREQDRWREAWRSGSSYEQRQRWGGGVDGLTEGLV